MKKPHRNENSRKKTPPRDETVKDAFRVPNVKSKRNPKPCCRCETSPQLSLIGTFDESVSTRNATPGSTKNVTPLSMQNVTPVSTQIVTPELTSPKKKRATYWEFRTHENKAETVTSPNSPSLFSDTILIEDDIPDVRQNAAQKGFDHLNNLIQSANLENPIGTKNAVGMETPVNMENSFGTYTYQ